MFIILNCSFFFSFKTTILKFQKIISYVFHPVLFPTVGTILFFINQPRSIPDDLKYNVFYVVFLSTYVIPVFFLFILKKKNSIDSYHLETIKERKYPMLFFFILNLLLGLRLLDFNITSIELLAISFISIASALLFIFILFYLKIKTSLHTLAIGGLLGFLISLSYHYQIRMLFQIATLFLLFGIVSFSRLKLKAHNQIELFLGFIIGVISHLITYYVYYL